MITSHQNPKIKQVRRLLLDRRYRQRQRAFVVEGTRWLSELVHSPAPAAARPALILASERWLEDGDHRRLLDEIGVRVTKVDEAVLARASDTETPSGVLAVLPMPEWRLPQRPGLLLVLDRLTDPGNLGTIVRTAAAAGADGLLLSPGCVDPYNPKAVRATMGALLRLPVLPASWDEIKARTAGLDLWLASAGGQVTYDAVDWRRPAALVIGSEATGIGPEATDLAGRRVAIPMAAQTESLNAAAAAAVLLFEARRQRLAATGG